MCESCGISNECETDLEKILEFLEFSYTGNLWGLKNIRMLVPFPQSESQQTIFIFHLIECHVRNVSIISPRQTDDQLPTLKLF